MPRRTAGQRLQAVMGSCFRPAFLGRGPYSPNLDEKKVSQAKTQREPQCPALEQKQAARATVPGEAKSDRHGSRGGGARRALQDAVDNRYKGQKCDQTDVCEDPFLWPPLCEELRVETAGQDACPQRCWEGDT